MANNKTQGVDLREMGSLLQQVVDEVKSLAQPADLDALERQGLVKKLDKSGSWYEVKDLDLLPKAARVKISEVAVTKEGRAKVKFKKASEFDRIAKKFRKLGL